MPTLRNASSRSFKDLRREESREFSKEEMDSPEVKRALRMGLLVEQQDEPEPRDKGSPQKRR
jgi:hypothetical protein